MSVPSSIEPFPYCPRHDMHEYGFQLEELWHVVHVFFSSCLFRFNCELEYLISDYDQYEYLITDYDQDYYILEHFVRFMIRSMS